MGKGPEQQTTTQQRQIPDFLQGTIRQGANVSEQALSGLQQELSGQGPQLVQPFTPSQIQGQEQTLQLAGLSPSRELLKRGQNVISSFANPQHRLFDEAGNIIDRLGREGQIPEQTQQTLEQSAQGDFLFGGDAFNEAVDASIRQAQPQIASTFASQGGRGAVGSGLAQTAMQQAASDAFARQFSQERDRQQAAAGQLGQLGLEQQRMNLQGPMALGDLLNRERGRQLEAAGELPQQALLGPELLQEIGGRRQQQQQRELREPVEIQRMLLSQGLNSLRAPQGFLGQQTTQPIDQGSPAMSGLGGALAGAQLGSVVPGLGTAVGAVGGGLAGLLS